MILMIDNYDSFTFNLVQYLMELGQEVLVKRNDELSVDDIRAMAPQAIVISPGPCSPNEAGISLALIESLAGQIPILGVCLGHQSICQVFGGKIIHAPDVMHGKTSMIEHSDQGLFKGLPNPFKATRYHSLIAQRSSLPEVLEITAWSQDGIVMGVKHKQYAIEGVQFHPESIATEHGHDMLRNFLNSAGIKTQQRPSS